jgi:4-hydroxybenzoate polyprenyltransferase
MAASPSSRKVGIPLAARSGLVLLLLGALIVALGSYFERGGISLYGLVIAVAGFLVYILASIRRGRENKKHPQEP